MRTQRLIPNYYILILLFSIQSGCQPVENPSIVATDTPPAPLITAAQDATATDPVTPTQYVAGEEINFTTSDGLNINGKIYRGGGNLAVLFTHQRGPGMNQKSWQYFAEELAAKGYTVATFNFRGIGKSDGDINMMENLVVEDTLAAIEYLNAEGFDRIVCIGAETGGTSCLEAAQTHALDGVVAITAVLSLGEPTSISDEDLQNLDMPKLFIYSEDNPFERIPEHMQRMYELSPEPKELVVFPGEAHGTNMFFASYKDEFRQKLIDFLQGIE